MSTPYAGLSSVKIVKISKQNRSRIQRKRFLLIFEFSGSGSTRVCLWRKYSFGSGSWRE